MSWPVAGIGRILSPRSAGEIDSGWDLGHGGAGRGGCRCFAGRGIARERAGVILAPDQRVRVFISSTLEEMAAERAAARRRGGRSLGRTWFPCGMSPGPGRSLVTQFPGQECDGFAAMDHAARAGDPAGSGQAQEGDLQLHGRRELAPAQGGQRARGRACRRAWRPEARPARCPSDWRRPRGHRRRPRSRPFRSYPGQLPAQRHGGWWGRLPPGQKLPERPGPVDHRPIAHASSLAHATGNPGRRTTAQDHQALRA